jgi:hypothetical protein
MVLHHAEGMKEGAVMQAIVSQERHDMFPHFGTFEALSEA